MCVCVCVCVQRSGALGCGSCHLFLAVFATLALLSFLFSELFWVLRPELVLSFWASVSKLVGLLSSLALWVSKLLGLFRWFSTGLRV